MKHRTTTILSMMSALGLGMVLFMTSEQVQQAEKDYRLIRQELRLERDALKVLSAEWTYLNRPERLEQLAATHLNLTVADVAQVGRSLAVIPERVDTSLATITPAAGPMPAMVAPAPVVVPVVAKAQSTPTARPAAPITKTATKPTAPRPQVRDSGLTFYQIMREQRGQP